jgi:hypothetical protein
MYTNAGFDMEKLRREAVILDQDDRFDDEVAKLERKSLLDRENRVDQNVPVVYAGSEEDVEDQYSFEANATDGSYDPDAVYKRIRKARERGYLQPAQILVDFNSNEMIGPKMRTEQEQAVVARGEACWRCFDFQPEMPEEHERLMRRLKDVFPFYRVPSGYKESDMCCYCGAILGIKEVG